MRQVRFNKVLKKLFVAFSVVILLPANQGPKSLFGMLNIFSRCTYFYKALCLIFILFVGSCGQRWPKFFSLYNLFCWVHYFMYHLVLWLLCWERNTLQKISEVAQGHTKSVQTTRPSEISSGHQPQQSSETKCFMTSSWNLSLLTCQIGIRDMK